MKSIALTIVIVAVLSGCQPIRRAKAPPTPGPIPARIPQPQPDTEAAPPPSTLPAPPSIAGPPVTASAPPVSIPETPTAVPPKPQTTKRAARRKPALAAATASASQSGLPATAESVPSTPAPTPEETSTPTWSLAQVLTPSQRSGLLKRIDELIAAAERTVDANSARSLTPEQNEMISRIKSFLQLARDARDRNPIEARALAQRAKTFADALGNP